MPPEEGRFASRSLHGDRLRTAPERPSIDVLSCDHRCRQQKKKFCPRERLHLDKKCPGKLINTLDSLARDSETTLGPPESPPQKDFNRPSNMPSTGPFSRFVLHFFRLSWETSTKENFGPEASDRPETRLELLTRTSSVRFLQVFTEFSDFLGRLQPSKTTIPKTQGTLGVEEETSLGCSPGRPCGAA